MSESLMLKVADLTECAICRESMRDPRILHCVHTFCFQCLLKFAKDQPAGCKVGGGRGSCKGGGELQGGGERDCKVEGGEGSQSGSEG